jgi:serine protease Do
VNKLTLRFAILRAVAVLAGLVWAGVPGPTSADPLPDGLLSEINVYRPQMVADATTLALQTDLAWLGLYGGLLDGRTGPETRAAVMAFEEAQDLPVIGQLSVEARAVLAARARDTAEGAGFVWRDIEWTGTRLRLPEAFFGTPEVFGDPPLSLSYVGTDAAGLRIEVFRYRTRQGIDSFIEDWRKTLTTDSGDGDVAEVRVARTQGRSAVMDWVRNGVQTLGLYQTSGTELRMIEVSFDSGATQYLRPVLTEILGSVDLFAGAGVREEQVLQRLASGDYPGGEGLPDWYRTMFASGSGSLVSYQGDILTNQHVVASCKRVTVNGSPAQVVGSDVRLDLALVRAPALAGRTPVTLAADDAELGMPVYVMGYPVFSTTQSVNLTEGIVSSVVGAQGNRAHIQITAPVQPGNSGGPVLTAAGVQVAVVVSKPSLRLALDDLIENIAWVIRASVARDFLERYGVRPVLSRDSLWDIPPGPPAIRDWRSFTVRIECHGS